MIRLTICIAFREAFMNHLCMFFLSKLAVIFVDLLEYIDFPLSMVIWFLLCSRNSNKYVIKCCWINSLKHVICKGFSFLIYAVVVLCNFV